MISDGLYETVDYVQDISLVGYDPTLNYEQQNMDNYYRASLMDKGPEEVIMPDEDFTPEMQREYTRAKLDRMYNPPEPVRKAGIDLNDYGMDFHLGEDIGTLQQEYTAQQRKRLTETQYFNNDSAKQVPIGQVAPTKQNRDIYWSRDSALRLRQDFIMEAEDRTSLRSFRGMSKKKILGYDPKRCPGAEKAFNDYLMDATETNRAMSHKKVKQMAAVFKTMQDLEFNQDAMVDILRGAKCIKPKNATDKHRLDSELGDNPEESLKRTFVKIWKNRPKYTGSKTDVDFDDSFERVARVSNIINKKAQARARATNRSDYGVLTEFDDAVLDPVKKLHQGKDGMDRFVRYTQDSDIPEDVREEAVKKVRNESKKLSAFYHKVQADDSEYRPNDDAIAESDPRRPLESGRNKNATLEHYDSLAPEDTAEERVAPKGFHKYDTQQLKKLTKSDTERPEEVMGNDPTGFRKSVQNARRNEGHKVYDQSTLDSAHTLGGRGNGKIHVRRDYADNDEERMLH